MSYIFDELMKLSRQTGKSLKTISLELHIPYSTVSKWKIREPHVKYKYKIYNYIEYEREKLMTTPRQVFSSKGEYTTTSEEIPVYDEDNIPNDFWDKLKSVYLGHKDGNKNWETEEPVLRNIIISMANQLKDQGYRILSPIDTGGTAVILKIRYEHLNVIRALKFARPIEKHKDLFVEIMTTEIGYLLEASHKNIVEIYFQGEIDTDFGKCPFYIMEFVKGAQSATKYFEKKRNVQDLIIILKQVVSAIKHLHSKSIVHLDIKPDNILVSSEGNALLSDLGSARKYDETDEEVTIIYSKPYAHPKLTEIKWDSTSDSNRNRGYIKRKELDKRFDIYAFGKAVIELIDYFDPNVITERMPAYERKYLYLMACRSLDGLNTDDYTALGLPRDIFKELKYRSFDEIADDLDKLTGEFPLDRLLPELNPYIIDIVQTGSNWKTPLTKRLLNLLTHPSLQRLTSVSQLGLLTHVYPTATHTRLQHTLGVFSNTIRIIEALYNDSINPLFKQIMNIKDLECLLLASLFHDIGHFPLAHDLHDAIDSIFKP